MNHVLRFLLGFQLVFLFRNHVVFAQDPPPCQVIKDGKVLDCTEPRPQPRVWQAWKSCKYADFMEKFDNYTLDGHYKYDNPGRYNVTFVSVRLLNAHVRGGNGFPGYSSEGDVTGLPDICEVICQVTWDTNPAIKFHMGLLLPMVAWNGNLLVAGNERPTWGIDWLGMTRGIRTGYATVSSSVGLGWTHLHEIENDKDWAWRAMHTSTGLSKRFIQWFYFNEHRELPPQDTWFIGCGISGAQGLKEIMTYSEIFHGVVIGAPIFDVRLWSAWATKAFTLNNQTLTDPIDAATFSHLAHEVIRQCDHQDLSRDGIVNIPEHCNFDYEKIQCGKPGVDAAQCLTPPQIEVVKMMYAGYGTGKAKLGLTPGSEHQWAALLAGKEANPLASHYMRHFNRPGLLDTNLRMGELWEFKRRGGKIIMYHGLADGLVPHRWTDQFYKGVRQRVRTTTSWDDLKSFFRYFQVPGMQHCSGTAVNAPWYIAGAAQPDSLTPPSWPVEALEDEKHDAMYALRGWVKHGRVVEQLIATTWNDSNKPSSGIYRQRPLCPFPERVILSKMGRSDTDKPASWSCTHDVDISNGVGPIKT